jgi:ribosome-associated heat shock protein Hsp15
LKGDRASAEISGRRLDQWLWFARFVKSRSLAARLCVTGIVTVNGMAVRKPNHMLRIGDILAAPQGAVCRTVRVRTDLSPFERSRSAERGSGYLL